MAKLSPQAIVKNRVFPDRNPPFLSVKKSLFVAALLGAIFSLHFLLSAVGSAPPVLFLHEWVFFQMVPEICL
ncbi:hypothetical protein [Pantoea sp. BAV 3049]|uniref:hypothetical protein n=1 Tax=Pantoea sp. BAV 3049 TaxID=2654188 RepID=UPI00131B65C4|nr:hypothetical protein [Pantoea sp. BAV 3049]